MSETKALREMLREVRELLRDLKLGQIEPLRFTGSKPEMAIEVVTVASPGSPVQGPDLPIPVGYSTTIRMRYHSSARDGYVSFNANDISNPQKRIQIRDNDSFPIKSLTNWNSLWFDASLGSTTFELRVERVHSTSLQELADNVNPKPGKA